MSEIRKSVGRMVLISLHAAALTLSQTAIAQSKEVRFPDATWTSPPASELQKWDKTKLDEAGKVAQAQGTAAIFVSEGGQVVYTWGDTSRPFPIYSVRKSLLSALIGMAVDKGKIDLTSDLKTLGIDDKEPKLTETEKTATVLDLLKSRSGVYHQAAFETDLMKKLRPARGSHLPGTFWYYNNWDFNALGEIFKRKTGQDVFSAFSDQIAIPLQMEDFVSSNTRWEVGISSEHAAYTFKLSARDLARFGYLYLRNGKWKDSQIVPTSWISDSLKSYSDAQKGVGYGYLWWIAQSRKQFTVDVGMGSYSARGNGGQYIVVIPEYDLVVIHLAPKERKLDTKSMGKILQLILAAKPLRPTGR